MCYIYSRFVSYFSSCVNEGGVVSSHASLNIPLPVITLAWHVFSFLIILLPVIDGYHLTHATPCF